MKRALQYSFVRFCLVGTLGFAINFMLLTLLYRKLHWSVFLAQLLSSELSLFSNFLLHHHWTYKDHNVEKTISRLLVEFHVTSWAAILGSAILVSLGVGSLHLHYFVALAVASVLGLGWNFGWTKFVIWRKHERSAIVNQ